jgi:Family of unknown function (DUF6262)
VLDERVDRLAQHARARAEQTMDRAQQALAAMAADGDVLTVGRLAHRAGVSRSWIYTQPELRDRIEQLRQTPTAKPAARASRASVDSLRRRLELAHERIGQLRDENRQLRESLALLHGQRRGQ